MTLISGFVSPHGYAGIVSDVRVSWGTTRELDAIRKTHPVGGNMAVAFANSVKLGFRVVSRFEALIGKSGQSGEVLTPGDWSKALQSVAGEVFRCAKRCDAENYALGVTLLMASATPRDESTAALYRLRSPDFEPERIAPGELVSIGSGSKNDVLMNVVKEFDADVKRGLVNPDAQAAILAQRFTHALIGDPAFGISPHFHIFYVERGRILYRSNEGLYGDTRWGACELEMPKVAATWREFEQTCDAYNLSAASASA